MDSLANQDQGLSTYNFICSLCIWAQFKTQATKSQVCLIHHYSVKNQPSTYQCTITHILEPIHIPYTLTMGTCLNCLWLWAEWPSMHTHKKRLYSDLLQALWGAHLLALASPAGILICASAVPHCFIYTVKIEYTNESCRSWHIFR